MPRAAELVAGGIYYSVQYAREDERSLTVELKRYAPWQVRSAALPEVSTTENEALVSRVYTQALQDRDDGRELAAADLMVYHIEILSQEVNSGASFEQYFRWASVEEISEAVARLESLALSDVAKIVRRAIDVAFPDGLPATDEEKSGLASGPRSKRSF